MRLNLHDSNVNQVRSHRRNVIENAFIASAQHHYRMPRPSTQTEDLSIEDIPLVYDLHSQNHNQNIAKLVPIQQLIRLSSAKKNNSVQTTRIKLTNSQLQSQMTRQLVSRGGKINCTISKSLGKALKKVVKHSWFCCQRQETLDRYETRQLLQRVQWKERCNSSMRQTRRSYNRQLF